MIVFGGSRIDALLCINLVEIFSKVNLGQTLLSAACRRIEFFELFYSCPLRCYRLSRLHYRTRAEGWPHRHRQSGQEQGAGLRTNVLCLVIHSDTLQILVFEVKAKDVLNSVPILPEGLPSKELSIKVPHRALLSLGLHALESLLKLVSGCLG